MNSLTVEQVLKEKKTNDPDSVKELNLGHKALTDVSCLSKFKNLEKLDLRFNNLTDLQGLKSCVNLKWLSVVENKLQSLNGIEALTKLTVLNAGKNKLKSMNEITSLVNLRALILNDNEISSICKLDLLKDLNSLVLSRNPISEIGDSLSKLKNLSKSCSDLKELRLANNEIKALPAELAVNKRLLNLDVGNNMITQLSGLEVLGTLSCLRNLNIRGNPISDNDKSAKKVRTLLLPSVNVFNAQPLEKSSRNSKHIRLDTDDENFDAHHNKSAEEEQSKEDRKSKKSSKRNKSEEEEVNNEDHKSKKKKSKSNINVDQVEIEKKEEHKEKTIPSNNDDDDDAEKKQKKAIPKEELDAIDDAETAFVEIFSRENVSKGSEDGIEKKKKSSVQETGLVKVIDTKANKKKSEKKQSKSVVIDLPMEVEIGLGGESKWE
ncbi:putative leucine-rich repeat domain superfamily [Arabidopsis thaliana]